MFIIFENAIVVFDPTEWESAEEEYKFGFAFQNDYIVYCRVHKNDVFLTAKEAQNAFSSKKILHEIEVISGAKRDYEDEQL